MSEKPVFKKGDIVKLKSGGPPMTVDEIPVNKIRTCVVCKWFSGTKSQVGSFAPEALTHVEATPGG